MFLCQQQLYNFYVCMHHGPTELDDTLRAFEELPVSIVDLTTIYLAEGIWKVHIFRHLFVCFQTNVYILGEFHENRNNSTVFEELSCQLWIWRSQISSKTTFATVKSTINTSNSSNTVVLFLNCMEDIWDKIKDKCKQPEA